MLKSTKFGKLVIFATFHYRLFLPVNLFNYCFLDTQDSSLLTILHELSKKAASQGKLMCSFCSFSTTSASNLKGHERNHSFKDTLVCKICNKTFSTKGNLKTHIRLHTGQLPYQCPICKKRFNENRGLLLHMMVHE